MNQNLNSGIYLGQVRHRRFSPKAHKFSYGLYMLAIDLDEVAALDRVSWLFGTKWWSPIRFKQTDYVVAPHATLAENAKSDPPSLKQRITEKAVALGETRTFDRVMLVAQVRCFGWYFSPINFYFLQHRGENVSMVAEVSNTPWDQTHYYLVDLEDGKNDKAFHVSPFMPMDMTYHWRVKPPKQHMLVHIENHQRGLADDTSKVFDATLGLKRLPLTTGNLYQLLFKHPAMTLKIVLGIYWQAAKLFAKRIPFIAYPNS